MRYENNIIFFYFLAYYNAGVEVADLPRSRRIGSS
jgi:hypothetical protein